jgi:hypothetical protein
MPARIEVVTPPAAEPLALADVKAYLRVDSTYDDSYIAMLIAAARRLCENHQSRAYITTTVDYYLDQFPAGGGYWNRAVRGMGWNPLSIPQNAGVIEIPRSPLRSVTSVKYLDASGALQTLDPAEYKVSLGTPGRVVPQRNKAWPAMSPEVDSVTIRAVVGYGDDGASVPATIRQAMYMLIGEWFEHRKPIESGFTQIPFAVDDLLSVEDGAVYG